MTKHRRKQTAGGKIRLSFGRIQFEIIWHFALRSVVRQRTMSEGRGKAKLMTSWQTGGREGDPQEEAGDLLLARPHQLSI